MSKLEELVPDIELCKLIPEGEFEDSCFVWVVNGDYQPKFAEVDRRECPFIPENGATLYPAPTLQEIMAKLRQDYIKVGTFIRSYWGCYIIDNYGDEIAEVDDNSPATAALKLLLKLKGIEQ